LDIVQISLFGKLAVRRSAGSVELPARAAELLCYLLLARGRPHTREALATTLWGETEMAQGKKYLRQTLWQLQQAFAAGPEPLLALDKDWIEVNPRAALVVDAHRLEDVSAALAERPGAPLGPADEAAARAAARLYRGALLDGWYHEWCLAERERYQALYGALLDRLADHCLAAGLLDAGIAYAQRLLCLEPTRERTHRRLMRLYVAAGDRGAALRQFALCAAALQREFGVGPAEPTLALAAHIRADESGAAEPPAGGGLADELAELRVAVASLRREVEGLKGAIGRRG
jgi:DNA-binding SARP family transcriptional activator